MQQAKGSITIFSVLSLLLITATIFALVEGTRFQEIRRFAQLQTESSLESAFANYNSSLWKNYRLLGMDFSQIEPIIVETANERSGGGTNLLQMKPEDIQLCAYTRLTDQNGKVFIKNVSSYMQDNFLYEAAKELYNQYETSKSILDSDEMNLESIDDALGEIQKMELSKEKKAARSANARSQNTGEAKTILASAKQWTKMGILELVLEDSSKVSSQKQDFKDGLLVRKLEKGAGYEKPTVEWKDQILLQQYFMLYMSNFRETKTDRALAYELEYLIAQKNSDVENLKAVANRLLGMRESINFLYLVSNPEKVFQAQKMAILLAGVSANILVIEAVKIGLLTAWALAESVLDVRAILAGKRIALLKSEDTWTTELGEIITLTSDFAMAKESPLGLYYEDYLGIFLFFEKSETLAMRAMNLQEATIRENTSNPNFRMDTLVTEAKVDVEYSYSRVFPFLPVIRAQKKWECRVLGSAKYGYY